MSDQDAAPTEEIQRQAPSAIPNQIVVHIQNVVATVNCQTKIDLANLAQTVKNVEYNAQRFSGAIIRIREPVRCTGLLFSSGKIIVTGAKDVNIAEQAGRKFVSILNRIGNTSAQFSDFIVHNITATCDLKFPIRLESLQYSHAKFAVYEPELFPGLVYRLENPKVSIIVFVTGKLVITGAKSTDVISSGLSRLVPVLMQFKKETIQAVNVIEDLV